MRWASGGGMLAGVGRNSGKGEPLINEYNINIRRRGRTERHTKEHITRGQDSIRKAESIW